MQNVKVYYMPNSNDSFVKEIDANKAIKKSFECGYDKAINDIMHIVNEADDCANAIYLLGQFYYGKKVNLNSN